MAEMIQQGDSATEVRAKLNALMEQAEKASRDAIEIKGEISEKVEKLQRVTGMLQEEKIFLTQEQYETLEEEGKIEEGKIYYIIEE